MKFNVDGQMVDAWGVRKGMIITVTKIVEEPAVEVAQKKTLTGEAAPTPPPADVPVLVAEGGEEQVPTPAAATAAEPEAASSWSTTWLVGLLVLLVIAAVTGWYVVRKRSSRS